MDKSLRYISTVLLLLASITTVAYAQETLISARVTYIAGQNVYLDAGRDQGIQPGDTLAVYRDGVRVGHLAVVSSISDRSVVTFAGDPFPLTLGTLLQVKTPRPPTETPPVAPPLPEVNTKPLLAPPEQNDASRPRETSTRKQRRSLAGPRLAGRVMLSLQAIQSNTKWNVGTSGTRKRTFATPSLNLNATVSDLPGALRLRTRLRADYRYTSGRSIDPTLRVRAYEVLVERDFALFSLQAGRFSNRYTPFGGYWDGVLLHVGGKRTGFGTVLGFMPDRSNEGFSTVMPRYTGFAHFEVGDRSTLTYSNRLSFNEIRPTNHLLNHRFIGLSQRLRWRGLYLRNDVQLDQDPETQKWIASRFVMRVAATPFRGVSLHGRYKIRRPYSIYRVQRVISYRRYQASGGVVFQVANATVGADVAFNFIDDVSGQRLGDGRTVSGYVQVPKTGVFDLGFSAMTSYWTNDDGSSLFVNTGISRRVGRARTRLNYQFYRTEIFTAPLLTHSVMVQAVLPLGGKLFTSSQVRLQQSTNLSSLTFYTSFWYSF